MAGRSRLPRTPASLAPKSGRWRISCLRQRRTSERQENNCVSDSQLGVLFARSRDNRRRSDKTMGDVVHRDTEASKCSHTKQDHVVRLGEQDFVDRLVAFGGDDRESERTRPTPLAGPTSLRSLGELRRSAVALAKAEGRALRCDDAVSQHPDAFHLRLHHVADLQPLLRRASEADAFGRAGRDDVARLERAAQ